jgi:hypothetical protein
MFVDPFEAKAFRASGYRPVNEDNWLVVHVSNTQEGFSVEDIPPP